MNEQHLRRLICDHANYHHDDRIHDALEKDAYSGEAVHDSGEMAIAIGAK